MTYEPLPMDVSHIELRDDLLDLVERLARHNHDTWAQGRLAQGWRHGLVRDDAAKRHPDLVPYDELPEWEKEFDRNMVTGTLRAVLSLGYRIEGPQA